MFSAAAEHDARGPLRLQQVLARPLHRLPELYEHRRIEDKICRRLCFAWRQPE